MLIFDTKISSAAIMGDYGIVCGDTSNCKVSTHNCYRCKDVDWGFISDTVTYSYRCVSKRSDPGSDCERSVQGGLQGASYESTGFGLLQFDYEDL